MNIWSVERTPYDQLNKFSVFFQIDCSIFLFKKPKFSSYKNEYFSGLMNEWSIKLYTKFGGLCGLILMRQEFAQTLLLGRPYNNVLAKRKIDRECNRKNWEKVEQLQKDSEATIQEAIFPVSHPLSHLPF
jgi:hypothetical protein